MQYLHVQDRTVGLCGSEFALGCQKCDIDVEFSNPLEHPKIGLLRWTRVWRDRNNWGEHSLTCAFCINLMEVSANNGRYTGREM